MYEGGEVMDDERRKAYREIIKGLSEYATAVHGERPYIPPGARLLEPDDGLPMAWKLVVYLEQLAGEKR
jgi:hypothetical protein